MPDTERTEPATPHRRREAREKGQVAKSIELNSAVVLTSSFLALRFLSLYIFNRLEMVMRYSFSNMAKLSLNSQELFKYNLEMAFYFGLMVLPFVLIVAVFAFFSNLIQVGFLHSWQILKPQISRINPMTGLKRIFSYRIFIELIRAILKICIASGVAYLVIKNQINKIIWTVDIPVIGNFKFISSVVLEIGLKISLAFLGLALIDYLYQRWEYEKSLRMTRQELKDELIRHEGRPEIKARIRSIQRRFAMRRMMQEVPKAEVIITNPTSLAIALHYTPKQMSAPVVVAKGARLIAEKIVQIAKEHNVPIVENKPLARLLFKKVDIGQIVPLGLYQTVAEVLAYLWRIGKIKKGWF